MDALIEPVGSAPGWPVDADEASWPGVEILLTPACEQIANVPSFQLPPLVTREQLLATFVVASCELLAGLVPLFFVGASVREDEADAPVTLRVAATVASSEGTPCVIRRGRPRHPPRGRRFHASVARSSVGWSTAGARRQSCLNQDFTWPKALDLGVTKMPASTRPATSTKPIPLSEALAEQTIAQPSEM